MPDIDSVIPVYYQGLNPYHVEYDNLPLKVILQRQSIINDAVDLNTAQILAATGTAGTIANRLASSLLPSGGLIPSAVDLTVHNIGAHTDGPFDDGDGSIDYVRFKQIERDKLELISDEATNFRMEVASVSFDDDTVKIIDSDTITWEVQSPDKILARMTFPVSAAHQHYYNLNPITLDYKNYKTTSVNTPYIPGSLRVMINGIMLNSGTSVYVPPHTGPSGAWRLIKYTEDNAAGGLFSLNITINSMDVIRINFDLSLV